MDPEAVDLALDIMVVANHAKDIKVEVVKALLVVVSSIDDLNILTQSDTLIIEFYLFNFRYLRRR